MSTISIADLQPTGAALFADTESYLKELTDAAQIQGGSDVVPIVQLPTKAIGTGVRSYCLSEPPKSYNLTVVPKI